jgi:LacI family transcriptional regulator
MYDVAAAAGVSVKTVSRVINLEPGVSDATVTRVHNAIAELGYRRNDQAVNLRKGISLSRIGLVIEDLVKPIYAVVARAVEQVADRNGRAISLASSMDDAAKERRLVTDLLRQGVDGLMLVSASRDHGYLEPDVRLGTRMVFLFRPPSGIDVDAVTLDDVGGARQAVEHLIAYGHRRIAYVGEVVPGTTAEQRLLGYRDALASADIPFDEVLVRAGPAKVESVEAAVHRLLARPDPPTAIFAQDSRHCVRVVRVLLTLKARVALVGYGDFDLADLLPVPVTVVAYDAGEVGRIGAELLFARLAGDSRPPQRIIVPTRLLARGSGELVAG